MSKDKHRAKHRMLLLLQYAGKRMTYFEGRDPSPPTISINCEGGMGYDHPDIQNLLKNRYIEMHRIPIGGKIRRTRASVTEKGFNFLKTNNVEWRNTSWRDWVNYRNPFRNVRNYL